MRINYLLITLILCVGLLAGCGSGTANTGNAGTAGSNKANTAANQNSSTQSATTADSAPLNMSIKDLGDKKVDELKTLTGRTLVFKTEGLKNFGEEGLTASYLSRTVLCKGDFSSYKDSIKAFQDAKGFIYADFKGVVDEIDDRGSDVYVKLKDCVLIKLEK